jgi:uncharacterized membrane protein
VSATLVGAPDVDIAEDDAARRPGLRRAVAAATAVVVLVGVVLRFTSAPPLWLDEAQGLVIARMGIPDLFQGLREDGAPPLYYLLLHVWTAIFGVGDEAVRSMSGLISTATLPIFWLAGRRLGGSRRIANLTLVLAAANPWLIRYGSEARMYALVLMLSLLVVLAMHRVWTEPTIMSGALLAAAGAALLYTHYWGLFLLAAAGVMAIVEFVRKDRRAAIISVVSLAVAALLFLPWIPTFAFQSAHTGTPWADRPHPTVFLGLLQDWSATTFRASAWTAFLLWPLILLGYGAVAENRHEFRFDLRGRSGSRWLAWLGALTLLIAYAACTVTRSAYTGRYTSVVFGVVVLLAAIGLARLPQRYTAVLTLLLVCFWLAAGAFVARLPRSQAGEVAAALNAQAGPADTIVFCPDQLGPSTTRLLRVPAHRTAFPTGAGTERVNWIDYKQRNEHASARAFADSVVAGAPAGGAIWLVTTEGYRTYGDSCDRLLESFDSLRGHADRVVKRSLRYSEHADLWRWTA